MVGRTNVGKSTLFNALTGAHAHTGNWNGVTVGANSEECEIGGEKVLFTDLPGVCSFHARSMEEAAALDYLSSRKDAFIVNVVDVRQLPYTLPFTEKLFAKRKGVVALTMFRDFTAGGGKVDIPTLSAHLGVPVYVVDSYKRRDVAAFRAALLTGKEGEKKDASRWKKDSFTPSGVKEGIFEKICYHPVFFLPVFLTLILSVFFLIFADGMPGTTLKNLFERFFCDFLPATVGNVIPTPWVRSLVCDGFLRSVGGVLGFLPQITLLYIFLFWMEESGYMNSVAFMSDGALKKIGLNGRMLFCILLGFGCSAQAILSTKGLENRNKQEKTVYALSFIPCSAKLPVYMTLVSSLFKRPYPVVVSLYVAGVAAALLYFLWHKGDEEEPPITDLPSFRIPNGIFFVKTLLFRIKQFIIKIVTVVAGFTLFVWFLSSFDFNLSFVPINESMLSVLCEGLKYLFYPVGVTDWQTAFALFSGLIAKENVAGLLSFFYPAGLPFSGNTALALCVFLLFCSPCVSAIAASRREIGRKKALKNAAVQTGFALLASYATYFALLFPWLFAAAVLLLILLFVMRSRFEKIRRKRRGNAKKVYR